MSTIKSDKLRLGVVTTSLAAMEPWAVNLIERLRGEDAVDLATVVIDAPLSGGPARAGGLYRLIRSVDRMVFTRPPAQPPVDALLQGVSKLQISSDPAGLEALQALDLDLLIVLEPTANTDAAAARTKFGAWAFDFSVGAAAALDVVGFWESLGRESTMGVQLLHLPREGGERRVIAATRFNTKFSGARNAAFAKARSNSLILRELRRLARERRAITADMTPFVDTAPRRPGAAAAVAYGVHIIQQVSRRVLNHAIGRIGLRNEMWALYVGEGDAPFPDMSKARKLEPFRGEAWADPFIHVENGETFIFFEKLVYREGRGLISVGRLRDGRFEFIGDVLDLEHHLSYPFIFRHGGELYMTPERYQADRVEVWRCVEFPLKWELHSTALEGRSPADTSLFFDGTDWWLFTNLSEKFYMDHCAELHIFKVDGPDLKSLTPHEGNPVVIGSQFARNGGRVVMRDGRIFRPAQANTFGVYGYGLNIMEVSRLSLNEYEEKQVRFYGPDFRPGLMGLHHLDAGGGHFVVDACQPTGGLGPAPSPSIKLS